ncbi:hypothetical protein CEXT_776651 [Caerostris extrusa]|uniref:Uncharacterized protein n=1 Tax=Caerostris extrusa TaxID=172846 RepID=A0AAV4WG02_CAEEX|nr:hypothetical protein CEXT_776651 [Caerostris extrusa]
MDLARGQSDRYELTFNSTRHILCEALKLHILIPEQIFSSHPHSLLTPSETKGPPSPILTARAERADRRSAIASALIIGHCRAIFPEQKHPPPSSFITLGEDLIGWFGQNALPSHEERG